jgi:hypothetical protein
MGWVWISWDLGWDTQKILVLKILVLNLVLIFLVEIEQLLELKEWKLSEITEIELDLL